MVSRYGDPPKGELVREPGLLAHAIASHRYGELVRRPPKGELVRELGLLIRAISSYCDGESLQGPPKGELLREAVFVI